MEWTFAKQADKIRRKYKKGLDSNNMFSKKSFDKEMNALMNEQEDFKAVNNINEETESYSLGGDLNKKLAEEYRRRGKDIPMSEIKKILGDDYATWEAYAKSNETQKAGANEGGKPFDELLYGKRFASMHDSPETASKEPDLKVEAKEVEDGVKRVLGKNEDYKEFNTNPIYDIAGTAVALGSSSRKYKADPLKYDRVAANYIDNEAQRRDVRRQVDEARIDSIDGIRNTGGSRSQQLRAINNATSHLAETEGKLLADSYEKQNQFNSAEKSRVDAANLGVSMGEKNANYADRRYVEENNNRINTQRGNALSSLAGQLKNNKYNDFFLNSRSDTYGFDNEGRMVNKQRYSNNPINDVGNVPAVELDGSPDVNDPILEDELLADEKKKVFFARGGKLRKSKKSSNFKK